jgi:putative transposase
LRQVIAEVRREYPFIVDAWVLLADHLHCIWTLPEGDGDFSERWGLIKAGFSREIKPLLPRTAWMTDSKERHRENTIWQRRFWEHQIRDDKDLHRHLDYIHYNPVKHTMLTKPADWPYSTFNRYVKHGLYPANWGENLTGEIGLSFGE